VRDTPPAAITNARNITVSGCLYFAALAALWIVLASRDGV
jgi:hypothetical protein